MQSRPLRPLPIVLAATLIAALLSFAAPASAQDNQPPIVFAGPDQVIRIGASTLVNLNASRTLDVDSDAETLRYVWTVDTPSYRWLPIYPTGSPPGRTAYFVSPTAAQVAANGYSIDIRLTVTDSKGASTHDIVTIRFRGPPAVAINATALLADPDATDTDKSGTIEDDERYTVNAVLGRPGQGNNDDDEWTIREGARLTLRGTVTPGAGSTGTPRFTYRWRKRSAAPNRAEFNIPARQVDDDSFTVDLPNDLASRGAIILYTLAVTDFAGLQTTKTVRINVVEYQVPPTVTVELASSREPAQDANALNPDNPVSRYIITPGRTVNLIATGADEDGSQARRLRHAWSGPGVSASSSNPRQSAVSRATFTAPITATHSQSFLVTVTVTDSTNRSGQDQILFLVADNEPPVANAPSEMATSDGAQGGTDRKGTVDVKGSGTDPDGDQLAYRWVETDADGEPLEKPTVVLVNADRPTVSFAAPQLSSRSIKRIYLRLTVIDVWGMSDTARTVVNIVGVNEKPIADADPDQVVDSGQRVQLNGARSSDADLNDRVVSWSWTYTGFESSPSIDQRPLTPGDRRVLSRFLPDEDGDFRNPLANRNTPGPSFTAPGLGGLNSVQLTFTLTVTDTSDLTATDTVTIIVADDFYSGYITGPDWCTNYSLGGPRTYAYDREPKDGVADVCSLPSSRREAVARQNALATLASLNPDDFLTQVRLACNQLTGDYGDAPKDLDDDVCATRQLTEPPPPVSLAQAERFYSGYISGPDWCTNYSLGGPRTYAHDREPKDGVADVCSLPYTRREAIARQNALETFTSPQAAFNSAVALACRRLGATVFEGDAPEDLATDICA